MERGADLAWLMDDDGLPDARLPGHAARAPRGLRLLGPGRRRRGRPRPAGLPDPAARRHPRRAPDGRRRGRGRRDGVIRDVVIPFNGVLVTRELVERIGTAARGVLHLGRRPRVPPARRAGRGPGRHRGRRPAAPPQRRRPRDADDVRPDDVQPHARATSSTTAWRATTWSTCASTAAGRTRWLFVAKTVWFYTLTRPSAARLRLSARAMCAGLRGDFTGHREVPVVSRRDASPSSSSPTTAPTCWCGCSTASPPRPTAPDAVFVVDNASTDHTARRAAARRPRPAGHPQRGQPRRRRRLPPRPVARRTTPASTGSG